MRVFSDLSLPGACDWLEVWCGRCFFRVIALAVWCCVSGRGGGGVVISCCCVVVSIEARWIKSHLAPWTPEAHAVINIANLAETNLNLASTHRLEMIMECVCLCVGWTGDRPAETMVCEHVWIEGRFWKEVDYAVCVCVSDFSWLLFYQRMPSVSQSPLGVCWLGFVGSEGKFGFDRFWTHACVCPDSFLCSW